MSDSNPSRRTYQRPRSPPRPSTSTILSSLDPVPAGPKPFTLPQSAQPRSPLPISYQSMLSNLNRLLHPEQMLKLIQLPPQLFQILVTGMLNCNPVSLAVSNIRIRELCVRNFSNFGQNLNDNQLSLEVARVFEYFGEVQDVELFTAASPSGPQQYAFVRYKRAMHAQKAMEGLDALNSKNGCGFRAAYSDIGKRLGIVGDDPSVEDNVESLSPFVFVGYPSGIQPASEKLIKSEFARVAPVRSICIRPSTIPGIKAYMIAEFADVETAIKIRQAFYLEDGTGANRHRLGHKELDVSIMLSPLELRKFDAQSAACRLDSRLNANPKGDHVTKLCQIFGLTDPRMPQLMEAVDAGLSITPIGDRIRELPLVWGGMLAAKFAPTHIQADGYQIGDANPEIIQVIDVLAYRHTIPVEMFPAIPPLVTLIMLPALALHIAQFRKLHDELKSEKKILEMGTGTYYVPSLIPEKKPDRKFHYSMFIMPGGSFLRSVAGLPPTMPELIYEAHEALVAFMVPMNRPRPTKENALRGGEKQVEAEEAENEMSGYGGLPAGNTEKLVKHGDYQAAGEAAEEEEWQLTGGGSGPVTTGPKTTEGSEQWKSKMPQSMADLQDEEDGITRPT